MSGTDERDDHTSSGSGSGSSSDSGHGSLDFFGDSASPTLPVPSTPASTEPVPTAGLPTAGLPTAGLPTAAGVPAPAAGAPRVRRGLRVRTLVFGLVLLVISGTSLLATLTSVHIDAGIVGLTVLIGAGALLLLGGLTAAVRDVREGGPPL